ncbi:TetR family transcriptional regulator [Ramlibacter sp. AN1015]|uniref:TetR family transcriptional regulator n=1 Tax=Ramlibacter sp. AN1015 TaxID=3133428 RepID=UPI0030BC73F6
MARRTKEEALATRSALLDAAEHVFQRQGVSASSLADIAAEAGASRGAIYWHFQDKADLFNAMMERVSLPLEHALHGADTGEARDPLPALHAALLAVLARVANDPRTRRVLEVATHKVEYVDGVMGSVRARHVRVRDECLLVVREVLGRAARWRGVTLPVPLDAAARGLHALVDGLIQNWLLAPTAFDLERIGSQALHAYLAGLGLSPDASAPETAAQRGAAARPG